MILDFAVITVVNGPRALRFFGGVAQDDPRLRDARPPLSHTHSVRDLSDFDPASKEDKANRDQLGGYCVIMGDGMIPGNRQRYGVGPNTACQGNDPRLSGVSCPDDGARYQYVPRVADNGSITGEWQLVPP